eukprot:1194194-Prorocentrum_minimum.AAC.4
MMLLVWEAGLRKAGGVVVLHDTDARPVAHAGAQIDAGARAVLAVTTEVGSSANQYTHEWRMYKNTLTPKTSTIPN